MRVKSKQRKLKFKTNYPELVNRNFKDVKDKFKLLYTDVTYLIWNGKSYYQPTIIDGFSKELIAFKPFKFNNTKVSNG